MLRVIFLSARMYGGTGSGNEKSSEWKNSSIQKAISGKVTDDQEVSLPGATVMFKGKIMVEWTFDATHYGFEDWYRGYFKVINNSNFVIDNISKSSDPTFTPDMQKKYIAVAKLMKGFSYINLTTFWGDVPYFARGCFLSLIRP
jgi:hypothetical protein